VNGPQEHPTPIDADRLMLFSVFCAIEQDRARARRLMGLIRPLDEVAS
jgi:hypothetical protein